MNLSPLRAQHARLQSGRLADESDPAAAITELFLMEECVARCEALAEEVSGIDGLQGVMTELSECIAASQTYLAAKSRRSRHEPLLRAYCIDALSTAAELLARDVRTRGSDCHRVMRACVRWLLGPAA